MTLKITLREEPKVRTLKLEGRVAGPWVTELERVWRSLLASGEPRKIRVDLCGINHMDANGRQVLAEIYKETGADFVADTPMTKYFAEEARLRNLIGKKEGD